MRLHYLIDTHGGPYNRPIPTSSEVGAFIDQLFREAELAEEVGFDALLVPERHGRTECFFPSPLILLAALAARTSRARIGSYILVLPLHHLINHGNLLGHMHGIVQR
ncbi:MAG: LLM class flavin-dependent oxidoreductase, partial [Acidobacteria bacterium]